LVNGTQRTVDVELLVIFKRHSLGRYIDWSARVLACIGDAYSCVPREPGPIRRRRARQRREGKYATLVMAIDSHGRTSVAKIETKFTKVKALTNKIALLC
jgi:hypothetical protein